jgi:hypothetical protein
MAETVESPLPRDRHGGFGGRAGETHWEQSRQGAPVRPNQPPRSSSRSTDNSASNSYRSCPPPRHAASSAWPK